VTTEPGALWISIFIVIFLLLVIENESLRHLWLYCLAFTGSDISVAKNKTETEIKSKSKTMLQLK
jgi:hypothetical protein